MPSISQDLEALVGSRSATDAAAAGGPGGPQQATAAARAAEALADAVRRCCGAAARAEAAMAAPPAAATALTSGWVGGRAGGQAGLVERHRGYWRAMECLMPVCGWLGGWWSVGAGAPMASWLVNAPQPMSP